MAEGTVTARLLTPNFVLGLLDFTARKPLPLDFSDIHDPNATMIYIAISSAAPTPWADLPVPGAGAEPQTLIGALPNLRNQRLRPRVGERIRAVTMNTLGEARLDEFAPCLQLVSRFGKPLDAGGASFRIAATDKAVIKTARQMFHNPFTGQILDAYLRAKAVEILCLMRVGLERRTPTHDADVIHEACARIDSMLAEPLDIGAIAEATHLSLRSLVRKFKEETGMTMGEYQRSKRLALAANLLLTTRRPITEIAGDVGFSETASFSRAFAQHFSLSPSEFRRLSHA